MTTRLTWALLCLSGVASTFGLLLFGVIGPAQGESASGLILAASPIVWWAVGALIVLRANGHRVGWLMALAGALGAAVIGGGAFITTDPAVLAMPAAPWGILIVSATYGPWFTSMILASMVLFPDGRLPGPRWRIPVLVPVVMVAVASSALVLKAGPVGVGLPANPIGLDGLPSGLLASLYVLDPLGIALLGIVGAVSLVSRFRRGTERVRAQLKWLLAFVVPVVIVTPIGFIQAGTGTSSVAANLSALGLLLIPVSVWIAVTRYRLYEIDRLISRTIGWALVTGVLAAVFAGGLLALQALLAGFTQGQTLAVAASTLVAFALFQPVRRRVQHAVDRRFDRARYDGERTAAAFAERLRGQIDLGGLETDLALTVGSALHPRSTGVWIRERRHVEVR